jgi:subtilisin family serine protease
MTKIYAAVPTSAGTALRARSRATRAMSSRRTARTAGHCGRPAAAGTPSVAITVGVTDAKDARASYSNYGKRVDLFAPGSAVLSSTKASDPDHSGGRPATMPTATMPYVMDLSRHLAAIVMFRCDAGEIA